MLGLVGAIYSSSVEAHKDEQGVTQQRLNTLFTKLNHMALTIVNHT
jgi:hypothetical protein